MTETSQKRSDRINTIITMKLSGYFKPEQLDPLSDPEIDILNDYFSNQQLKELKNAPAQMIQGLVSRHVKIVERQRLTNIPVDELPQMLEYYKTIADEVEEVVCNKCGNTIAIEIKHPDYDSTDYFHNPNLHWQGRFVIAVGNRLFGYRKRHDDVMGYRCGCFIDNPEYIKAKEQYGADTKKYDVDVIEYDKAMKVYNGEVKKRNKRKETESDFEDIQSMPTAPTKPETPEKQGIQSTILCYNESTMSKPELEAVSEDHLKQSVITQSDILKIKQHISSTNYKKPVKKVKTGYELDGKFTLRKVK